MSSKSTTTVPRTITIPSTQTLLFILLLVVAITTIIAVAISVKNEPIEPAAPSVSSSSNDEGPAAWLSAWGQATGAAGTAGALWLGAVTFQRQVRDRHRAQASAITVGVRDNRENRYTGEVIKWHEYFIRNDSPLPIYHVTLYFGPIDSRRSIICEVLPPGEEKTHDSQSSNFMAFGKFVDSSGVGWKRDGSGKLVEIPNNDGEPWPME